MSKKDDGFTSGLGLYPFGLPPLQNPTMKDVNFSGLQNNKEVIASQNLSIKCTGDHGAREKRKPTLHPPCVPLSHIIP